VGRADGPLPEAVRRVLDALDPTLGEDRGVLAAVQADAEEMLRLSSAAKTS
jgi:hypothetical protein